MKVKYFKFILFIVIIFIALSCNLSQNETSSSTTIDIHNHLDGLISSTESDFEGAAEIAVNAMSDNHIQKMIIMPPPFTPDNQDSIYNLSELVSIVQKYPNYFAFFGGGESLNFIIQQAVRSGETTSQMIQRFQEKAAEFISNGAIGFGEIAIEHLSMSASHVYQSAPANHTLLLLLSDLAASYNVPIDIHMEAVPSTMLVPAWMDSPHNPEELTPNIDAFKELLSHNPNVKIIWSHVGWDNTGSRTATLTDELLGTYPNLYVSIKIAYDCPTENRMVDENGIIRTEWLDLINKYPERFLIGSDHFYVSPLSNNQFPLSVQPTNAILSQLSDSVAKKVGYENAKSILNL